jgi:spermidine/putrescine transport system substrate-binding protein
VAREAIDGIHQVAYRRCMETRTFLEPATESTLLHELVQGLLLVLVVLAVASCNASTSPKADESLQFAKELVFYDWAEDMPQSVLDAFTAEYGVKITCATYASQEEAVENIRAGKVYDVAVIENQLVAPLIRERLLAAIDFRNIPNFRNISSNFRDLAIDPGNQHTVPYHFGTTGLLIRTDLVDQPVTRWADLWIPRFAGRIGLRPMMRDVIGMTLLCLGYPQNSEDPVALEAAGKRLLELRSSLVFVDVEASQALPGLITGELLILVGWAEDYVAARGKNPGIRYVVPSEGTVLWGDNYVIPASSPYKNTAEVFLNFLLRPEISARIVNEKNYANANEAARAFIHPATLNDPVIHPTVDDLRAAHVLAPLSPEGEKLYQKIWTRFLSAGK